MTHEPCEHRHRGMCVTCHNRIRQDKQRRLKKILPFYLQDVPPDDPNYWAIGISKDQRYAGGVRGWKNGRAK